MADRVRGGHHAGAGAGGGGPNPRAAHAHGPRADQGKGRQGSKEKGLPRNENRAVVTEKVIYTGSPYKSEYTSVKLKNRELQKAFDDMRDLANMIPGTPSADTAADGLREYRELLEKVKALRKQIKEEKGMAIPLPKKLRKLPTWKVKVAAAEP